MDRECTREERLLAWSMLVEILKSADLTEKQQEALEMIDNYINPPKGGDGSQQIILNFFN